ncbi:MAG: hypothetical protein Q7S28_01000 [bacterium]|nr:hypothetical protein [bacterium]
MIPRITALFHDHIDGSAAVEEVIADLYALAGKPFPFVSTSAWKEFLADSSKTILERFDTITSVVQSREALIRLAYAYGVRRAKEGYEYVEGKFAPQYHTRGGLTLRQVADAVFDGLRRAEREHKIKCVPVICIGREADELTGIAIANIACEYGGEMVLDMVSDEPGNPPEKHRAAYEATFGTSVKRDCHAGEWVSGEPRPSYLARLSKNIETALYTLKCDSIGHAIPLGANPDLVKYVVDRGIRVTGCPLSNLTLGHIRDVRELHINYLLDSGVCYTLNPDDDLFLPPMNKVLEECDRRYRFTKTQCRVLEENARKGRLIK